MTPRLRSLVMSSVLIPALLVAMPGSATTGNGTITGSTVFESCFAGTDGSCSASATADPGGAFSGSVELSSADVPYSRSTRYSMALARYTIGFDLEKPTREAEISVTFRLDEARTSWTQDAPEVFGGTRNADSGAKVLFQLLGHEAPDGCGCGWPIQGSPNLYVVRVTEPGRADLVFNSEFQVTMTARNPFGDNLLPAGHYEVLLRGYALADLIGTGDWGTLGASMIGEIKDVSVSTSSLASNLALSVTGNGSSRTLTAVLTEDDSDPINGRTITFFGDGERLGTAVTENGVATLLVEGKFRGGSRLFRAEFAGDDSYQPSSAEVRS